MITPVTRITLHCINANSGSTANTFKQPRNPDDTLEVRKWLRTDRTWSMNSVWHLCR